MRRCSAERAVRPSIHVHETGKLFSAIIVAQVWRAHRAQFFEWQKSRNKNGGTVAAPGGAAVRAITMQLEVRCLNWSLNG